MIRARRALWLLTTVLAVAGCVVAPQTRCPTCRVLMGMAPPLPALKPNSERLFIVVPGMLGQGWEWDTPVERLRRAPAVDFVVFWWHPWGSIEQAATELGALVGREQAAAPASLREIVVVAHSAAGLVAAHALAHLPPQPPAGAAPRLTFVTIGAPFAGMHFAPSGEVDVLHAPLMLSIATRFHDYPAPPPGVKFIEYVTSYPADPVMRPYWHRSAAPPGVGPAGAERIEVDPRTDHNTIVDQVVAKLLAAQE